MGNLLHFSFWLILAAELFLLVAKPRQVLIVGFGLYIFVFLFVCLFKIALILSKIARDNLPYHFPIWKKEKMRKMF